MRFIKSDIRASDVSDVRFGAIKMKRPNLRLASFAVEGTLVASRDQKGLPFSSYDAVEDAYAQGFRVGLVSRATSKRGQAYARDVRSAISDKLNVAVPVVFLPDHYERFNPLSTMVFERLLAADSELSGELRLGPEQLLHVTNHGQEVIGAGWLLNATIVGVDTLVHSPAESMIIPVAEQLCR